MSIFTLPNNSFTGADSLSRMLRQTRAQIAQSKQRALGVVEEVSKVLRRADQPFYLSISSPEIDAPAEIKAAIAGIPKVFDYIFVAGSVLDELATTVAEIWVDTDIRAEVRWQRADEAIATTRIVVEKNLEAAATLTETMKTDLRKVFRPARPEPQDTVQEVALEGIKSDIKMVLDPVPMHSHTDAFDFAQKVGSLFDRYAANGNKLAMWVLAGSDFYDMYLVSRCGGDDDLLTVVAGLTEQRLTATAQQQAGPAGRYGLQLLDVMEGPDGLHYAIEHMRMLASAALDDVATYHAERHAIYTAG